MTTRLNQEEIDKEAELDKQYDLVVAWLKTATIKEMVNAIADAHQPKGKEGMEVAEMYPFAYRRTHDAIERLIDVVLGDEEDHAGASID